MKKTATIILNRNLPEVTDKLYESFLKYNGDVTDIFVIEAGSDEEKLSKYCTWWANWEEACKHGLRVPRGFNFGLSQLWNENRFKHYDQFFMLTNDTEFEETPTLEDLLEELEKHPRVGILSPCGNTWGERILLKEQRTQYFWYILNTAYLMRREFIESVMELEDPNYMNFLYDGTNFRGYGTESELIAKGYANDWASAITTRVYTEENESYLRDKADLIKTEPFELNIKLYIEEGTKWMRRKYGFNSRWTMQMYVTSMYEQFFVNFPELTKYKI